MKKATKIFEKHWVKATSKPLDETTKKHMKYCIDAINEALTLDIMGNINDKEETKALSQVAVSGALLCYTKDTIENEKTLIRDSKNGLKYLIFDNDTISYARVGINMGEYETIHFDGTNGKLILESWCNDH